jgi:hypothetical protein
MSKLIQLILSATGPRSLARFTQQCRNPMTTQEGLLRHILTRNHDTEFGRAYGFSDLVSVGAFKKRVPIQTYEDHHPYVEKSLAGTPRQLTLDDPVFFATTSGTTGVPKYIPVTPESRSAKSQLVRLTIYSIYKAHPRSLSGRILSLVSPEVESHAPSGVPCGAESGHAYRNMPSAMSAVYSCPYEIFAIKNYDAKYYTLLRIAAGQDITLVFSCNPSTVLLLSQRLADCAEAIIRDVRDGTLRADLDLPAATRSLVEGRLRPDPERAGALERAAGQADGRLLPKYVWPNLATVACWKGGSVGIYVERFDEYLPKGTPVHDIGYLSSEHRGSLPLTDQGDAGVLTVGTNFFEFFPADEDPKPRPLDLLTADELEIGKQYFIYVTTLGGLYRYDMNDIIEVSDFYEHAPVIRFIQKGKGVVSFTGEKLTESQVIGAVRLAFAGSPGPADFIGAVGQMKGDRPRYTFLVEFEKSPGDDEARALIERVEAELRASNVEYAGKRDSGRIDAPTLRVVRAGEFDRYRKRKVERGRTDAQFKVLRLTSDAAFPNEFEAEREVAGSHSPAR